MEAHTDASHPFHCLYQTNADTQWPDKMDSPPIALASLMLCSLQLSALTHAALQSAVSHSDRLPVSTQIRILWAVEYTSGFSKNMHNVAASHMYRFMDFYLFIYFEDSRSVL